MHVQIWENWYLRTDIYPQAAPIIAHLPLGYAQGFTIAIQVSPGCIPLPLCLSCAPDITRERLRALFTSGQQGRLLLCAAHWRSACPLCGGDGDSVPDCPLQASGRAALHLSADCYSGTVRAGAPPLSPHDGCPKHCTGPAAATCRAEHVDACMPVAVKVYLHTCSSRATSGECWFMTLLMSAVHLQVNQSAGAVDLVNVSMSGVFGSPMTDVAQVRHCQSTASLQCSAIFKEITAGASTTSACGPSVSPSD